MYLFVAQSNSPLCAIAEKRCLCAQCAVHNQQVRLECKQVFFALILFKLQKQTNYENFRVGCTERPSQMSQTISTM